jgi:phosphomannomutase
MDNKILLLFDVDGTLTLPRLKISEDMTSILQKINKQKIYNKGIVDIGFVGGSDLSKQLEQLGEENMNLFTWKFTENGLVSFYKDELLNKTSLIDHIGEDNYQKMINVCLRVLSDTKIPVKRGNFIELRNGMINISPIGRSCSQKERDDFDLWDKENKIREKIINSIQTELPELDLQFSIGGQISIDVFPRGWDKTYCLQFVDTKYDTIYFFGDKTTLGGNDHEIYNHPRVNGNNVKSYKDTIELLTNLLEL